MTDLERELLELVLEQTIAIRNLKIKIRLIDPEGEFYPPEDWHHYSYIVQKSIQLLEEVQHDNHN